MAFTISHTAAILPLYRYKKYLPFDALLIGTMMPDLPYFLSQQNSDFSHQWQGVIGYCLPYGIISVLIWRYLWCPALLALSTREINVQPQVQQRSIYQNMIHLLAIGCALMIGASTHLIWDGITHHDGFIALQVTGLQQSIVLPIVGEMVVTRLLQYLSSIIGLVYLLYFMCRKCCYRYNACYDRHNLVQFKFNYVIILFFLSSALGAAIVAMYQYHRLIHSDQYLWGAKILVGLIQGFGLAVSIYAVIYGLFRYCRSK